MSTALSPTDLENIRGHLNSRAWTLLTEHFEEQRTNTLERILEPSCEFAELVMLRATQAGRDEVLSWYHEQLAEHGLTSPEAK